MADDAVFSIAFGVRFRLVGHLPEVVAVARRIEVAGSNADRRRDHVGVVGRDCAQVLQDALGDFFHRGTAGVGQDYDQLFAAEKLSRLIMRNDRSMP
jgi:hypothetical protein